MLPITHYGWAMDGGTLRIEWDSQKKYRGEEENTVLYLRM